MWKVLKCVGLDNIVGNKNILCYNIKKIKIVSVYL